MTDPPWYKIREILIKIYLILIKPLYDILEEKKVSKSEPDIFAQTCVSSYHGKTSKEWKDDHKKHQGERALTMALGNFHQNLMGVFPGWKNLGVGDPTGCDIATEDGTSVAEIKNNTNTMNSSSKESVMGKLKKQKDMGKRAILVIVNGDTKHSVKDGIEIMSGRKFYEELSGRPTFMDDLLSTIKETFSQFKTFDALKLALGNS